MWLLYMFSKDNLCTIDISSYPLRVKVGIYIYAFFKVLLQDVPAIYYALLICKSYTEKTEHRRDQYKLLLKLIKYPERIFCFLSKWYLSILNEAIDIFLFIPKQYR